MKPEERWPRNPFCTCPEWGFTGPMPDPEACRQRAPIGINPHPVLTEEDMREGIAKLRAYLAKPYQPDSL